MKLNNRGWGTSTMIICICGLLICLLIAIYFIGKLYGSLEQATSNKYYVDLETKIENAAYRYVLENDIIIEDENYINYSLLHSLNYIDELRDKDNNLCDGYVVVTNPDGIPIFRGFITCPNYKTGSISEIE